MTQFIPQKTQTNQQAIQLEVISRGTLAITFNSWGLNDVRNNTPMPVVSLSN